LLDDGAEVCGELRTENTSGGTTLAGSLTTVQMMRIRVHKLSTGAVEIAVEGELDDSNAHELRAHLLDFRGDETRRVLLNLSGLESIDTAGMALLVLARIEIEAHGGTFVIEMAPTGACRAVKQANLERFVTIHCERIAALAALGGVPEPA
jgi:anti-anti-sigma factor